MSETCSYILGLLLGVHHSALLDFIIVCKTAVFALRRTRIVFGDLFGSSHSLSSFTSDTIIVCSLSQN